MSSSILSPLLRRQSSQLLRPITRARRALSASPGLADYYTPTPFVHESVGGGWHSYDIFSRLLKERIITLNGPVHDGLSSVIVAQLLFLEAENPEKPINLYINSPGGSVTAGLAIYDTMNTFERYGAPAEWRVCGAGNRYCDTCKGDTEGQREAEYDLPKASNEAAYA